MKRTRFAITTALLALLAWPSAGRGQDPSMWRPAVTATPVAPVASPAGQVWQPAVYASPYEPMYYPGTPAQLAAYGGGADGCATGGCTDRGGECQSFDRLCHDFWADRFGVCGSWGSVEYLHVWALGRSVPALITTSPDNTPVGSAGVLPGATILFGNERVGDDSQSAGRLTFGVWLDECDSTGVGLRLFGIEGSNAGLLAFSDGTGRPIVAIPFNNVQTGQPDAVQAAFPDELAGFVNASTSQDVLTGELYLRTLLMRGNGYRLDLVGGYHYTQVSDGVGLHLQTTTIDPGGVFPIGSTIDIVDRFDARNDFHGGSGGLQGELRHGCWRVHSLAKVSVGNMRQVLTVSGDTTVFVNGGASSVDPNGLFTQASNIGTFSRDVTTYVPEIDLSLGYQLNNRLEFTVGYTFLYWANVLAAGDQIDTSVDLSQTVARPAVNLRDTDFWVQGVSMGLNWNY